MKKLFASVGLSVWLGLGLLCLVVDVAAMGSLYGSSGVAGSIIAILFPLTTPIAIVVIPIIALMNGLWWPAALTYSPIAVIVIIAIALSVSKRE